MPLGVLKAARTEYESGFAIEYHLGVAATVFSNLLEQASYLIDRTYYWAAAVLIGAALEEGLRSRAKAEQISLADRETLDPLITKLTKSGTLSAFDSDRLRSVAKLRNDAAHGGTFGYSEKKTREALKEVNEAFGRLLGRG